MCGGDKTSDAIYLKCVFSKGKQGGFPNTFIDLLI